MKCKNCSKEFEITKIEKDLYAIHKLHEPNTCYDCRRKQRYNLLPDYGFTKKKCHDCGDDVLTANKLADKRPVLCTKCYRDKFLDKANS